MATDLETRFHRAMVGIYETAKRELNYNATRFLQMVVEDGGLAAARKLLATDGVSDGFASLWERKRLDLTVEAHVLDPDFRELFSPHEVETARTRLRQYGYDSA